MRAETLRSRFALIVIAIGLATVACGHESVEQQQPAPNSQAAASEPLAPDVGDGWLSFELQGPETERGDKALFHATYRAEGKVARFDIEVNSRPPAADGLQFGRFISVPGSDSSVFLRNLKPTLGAKKLPSGVARAMDLPFDFVLLGKNMSHSAEGGMFAEPPGHWTTLKVFFASDKEDCEVFLNMNTSLHTGEFSIKDDDYGDSLLRYFAKVL